jgi:hypothetical protein
MGTIARPRTSQKNVKDDFFDEQPNQNQIVQPKKDTKPTGGMGKAKKTIQDESIKNKEGLYEQPEVINEESNTNEPSSASTDTEPILEGCETVGEGDIQVISEVERLEEERRHKFSVEKRDKINDGAEHILSCLEPQFAHEFKMAASEFQCKDIGVYILAILNRLSKESDWNNPDFEPEWERGVVGFTDEIFCEYCNKKITTGRRKQKYCSNLCAKYDREQNETGIIHPDETIHDDRTVEDIEAEQYRQEIKRNGGIE